MELPGLVAAMRLSRGKGHESCRGRRETKDSSLGPKLYKSVDMPALVLMRLIGMEKQAKASPKRVWWCFVLETRRVVVD